MDKQVHQEKKTFIHLLCYNVAPVMLSALLTRPEAVNLSLDLCKSLQDAQEKIKNTKYELFLLDFDHPASSKILLEEIKKYAPTAKVALILNDSFNSEQIDELKNDKRINYVFNRPQFEHEIDDFLKNFLTQKNTFDPNRLAELKEVYDQTIEDKLLILKDHITKIQLSSFQREEHLIEIRKEIHKIAGSAGSFGYQPVSLLCKAMEHQIDEQLKARTEISDKWLHSLELFYDHVKEAFKTSTFDESAGKVQDFPLPNFVKPILYVVDADIHFLELLERIKDAFSLELITEFDPIAAHQKLKSNDFNPSGIVFSQIFPSSPYSGFDLMKLALEKRNPSPLIALLLDQNTIDIRLEAIEKGSHYIFPKPISAPILLKSMADALEVNEIKPLKVLVVDDDVDFCNYMGAVLSEIGATSSFIHNATDLYQELEIFKPDILLLDIMMPKYDGINLLKTLRQDVRLKNLIIILITASEKIDIKLNAYAASVDDLFFKPLDKNLFQKKLLNIAGRKKDLKENIENYTGLYQLKELLEELTEQFNEIDRSTPSYLALFNVYKFSEWSRTHGHMPTQDLIIYISNQLQWEADHKMKYYWYKGSIFAVVFENVDFNTIEKKMFTFLTHLVQSKSSLKLNFNCTILPISKKFRNPTKLLQIAEESLMDESKEIHHPVNILHKLPSGEHADKKEVMIVDPNNSLLKILSHAFESHGIKVKTYIEGTEALKDILSAADHSLPSLIIVERKLPDMDGMDLFIELKNRFKTPIPFFMLTVFAADKDISDGLSKGIEYIVKPFNISILMQKSLQILSKTH